MCLIIFIINACCESLKVLVTTAMCKTLVPSCLCGDQFRMDNGSAALHIEDNTTDTTAEHKGFCLLTTPIQCQVQDKQPSPETNMHDR